jgi:hypothetical protein
MFKSAAAPADIAPVPVVPVELIPVSHLALDLPVIVAGGGRGLPLDYDELERWTRIGYERGMRSRKGER